MKTKQWLLVQQDSNAAADQTPAVNPLAGWLQRICQLWAQGPASTVALGKVVLRARQSLVHGQWSQLWRLKQMPFCQRKAGMFMFVGQGLGELNEHIYARLPHGLWPLYELASLDKDSLLREVEQGAIHP